ncbi:hypothetical protein [Telmatospirillum sp. J64-1]|uniref:hypothetical protein n=1 Tax=Telmatospirillum sp. J64-1 TaxID=2502183 RepID=UPI00115E53F6|nr:hypothetical protein [Telmatospirillum sp. J64-1]
MSESARLQDISPEQHQAYLVWRERVAGTNISSQTLLATDYLNHFNEIVMLLEMLADMPDMLDEAKAWQPKSYQEHFRDSAFHDRDLAIEAYDHVPEAYRRSFEDVIGHLNEHVSQSIARIEAAILAGTETAHLHHLCGECSRTIQKLMDFANAVIHGSTKVLDQEEVDRLLGP